MKKDYVPVRAEETSLDEIELVEQYWTAIWEQSRGDPATHALGVTQHEEHRIMAPYLDRIPNGRILDGGCGLGEWTVGLSACGYTVYGVDISRKTIAALRARFPQHHFSCGDIRHLDFADDFFDLYFSWGVFEHFEDGLEACVTEASRILRPGGYLLVSVPFQNWRHILRDCRPLSTWDQNYEVERGYKTPMRFYQWRLTKPELHRELALRGFSVERICAIHKQAGISRWLEWDVRLKPGTRMFRLAQRAIARWIPAGYVSHMILAVAQKSEAPHG